MKPITRWSRSLDGAVLYLQLRRGKTCGEGGIVMALGSAVVRALC